MNHSGIKYLALSVALHGVAIGALFIVPLMLQGPTDSLFGTSSAYPKLLGDDEEAGLIEKNQLLDEVFTSIVIAPHRPYDAAAFQEGKMLSPHEEIIKSEHSMLGAHFKAVMDDALLYPEALALEWHEKAPLPLMEVESSRQAKTTIEIPLKEVQLPQIQEGLSTPYEDVVVQGALRPVPLDELSVSLAPLLPSCPLHTETVAAAGNVDSLCPPTMRSPLFTPKYAAVAPEPRLIEPSAQEGLQRSAVALSSSVAWNEDFTTQVVYAPHPKGKGYIFSVALTPKQDLSSHRLKQHFYFILDRSSSSQKHHFLVFKKAALKALASMQRDDEFNIFVLDKTITRFRPSSLLASSQNIQAAEEFLNKQSPREFLSHTTLYTALPKILPSIPDDGAVHTAIVLSDGNSSMSAAKKREVFNKWFQKNQGKLSVYAATVGAQSDLLSLDLLSTESGGRLLYSDTHAALPRKLAKLILDLKNPIANEIELLAKPHSGMIELYPAAATLPSLYSNGSYVVFGASETLDPFELVLKGRHDDEWIAIRKQIHFKKASLGDVSFIKQWKKTQASLFYAQFLDDGNPAFLRQAKELAFSDTKNFGR